MHPFVVQQLAAEHVTELLAEADDARRARQARRARRPRNSWQGTRMGGLDPNARAMTPGTS